VGRTLDTQATLSKLRAMRRRGEDYSGVIIRLVAVGHTSPSGSRRASRAPFSIPPFGECVKLDAHG
jgi:hypothetical protein